MIFAHGPKYSSVNGDEEKSDSFSTIEPSARSPRTFATTYNLFIHLIVISLAGICLLQWSKQKSEHHFRTWPSELCFARDRFDYVEKTFQPGGFTDLDETPSAYFGAPTPEKDELWAALYDVGMTVITEAEYRQMNVETTHLVDDQQHYLVTIEMFHQLHCLDYIRHVSYTYASGKTVHHPDESEAVKVKHIDHCIDYLRQVIQCHGDLTPITLEIIPGVPVLPPPNPAPYKPDFSIRHTCRDFDQIYDFALQRNTSGYKVA